MISSEKDAHVLQTTTKFKSVELNDEQRRLLQEFITEQEQSWLRINLDKWLEY